MQGGAPVVEAIVEDPLVRLIVHFDFDSDKIQKRSEADLREVAKAMNDAKNKGARYEIGGYTDNVGKDEYNTKLSERRAASVKNWLVKNGKVDAGRLLTVGYGPTNPIVGNDTPANRAVNRRVEFKNCDQEQLDPFGGIMKYTSLLLLLFAVTLATGRVFAQGSERYIINHFVSDPKVVESHLVITDVEGKGPIVAIKLYDNNGTLLGEGKELVQPFGKLNLNPGKYINNKVANGTIHLETSGGNIVAEYWQFYKNAAESWKNTTTIGQEKKGHARLVCPHFVPIPVLKCTSYWQAPTARTRL
jgi:hypothetical protein